MQNIYNSVVRISANNKDIDYLNPQNIIIDEPSIGTGFFITAKYIITCAHVIDTAEKIYFNIPTLSDTKYEAKIKGICPTLDLAILETIDYDSNFSLKIPNTENIDLQDKIFVIGFPLGRDKIKVTQGIISGLQDGYIQIDSAINSGNSGGPLLKKVDSEICVIGIISSKVINADGVGYAIPIELLNIFRGHKPENRVYNSCNFLSKFSNTSESRINMINHNLNGSGTVKSGYTISNISKASPLLALGLSNGDLIINFNDKEISNSGEINITIDRESSKIEHKVDIVDHIERMIPGEEYPITTYSFKNNRINTDKIIFPTENLIGIKKIVPFMDHFESIVIGGLVITPLTINLIEKKTRISLKLRKYISYSERFTPKVVIVNILPNSPFRLSENIHPGDILSKINDSEIETIAEIRELLRKIKSVDKYVTLETDSGMIDTVSYNLIKDDIENIKKI